jgi:hypothetical protein
VRNGQPHCPDQHATNHPWLQMKIMCPGPWLAVAVVYPQRPLLLTSLAFGLFEQFFCPGSQVRVGRRLGNLLEWVNNARRLG